MKGRQILTEKATLALENGAILQGYSFGCTDTAIGEVIFNTSITGYQEIVTDPSYARQIITLTHPQIGNVGANDIDVEANVLHASALVVKSLPKRISNWRSEFSLDAFLKTRKVAGIYGIDTRKLTRMLRTEGALNGCLMCGDDVNETAVENARAFAGLKGMDLAKVVSTKERYDWKSGSYQVFGEDSNSIEYPNRKSLKVIAYDFGIKQNILRMLTDRGCSVTVVPAQTDFNTLDKDVDGYFLSNGPGDPEPCVYAIESIREMFKSGVPVFGICLGHQLLGLSSGARTQKMKFGHHGANHPVRDLFSGEIMITSQNHGFAVDDESLPADLIVTHRSLFDGTIQGLQHAKYPAFSFQGHPEASPGPRDCGAQFFDRFVELMQQHKDDRLKHAEAN